MTTPGRCRWCHHGTAGDGDGAHWRCPDCEGTGYVHWCPACGEQVAGNDDAELCAECRTESELEGGDE